MVVRVETGARLGTGGLVKAGLDQAALLLGGSEAREEYEACRVRQ